MNVLRLRAASSAATPTNAAAVAAAAAVAIPATLMTRLWRCTTGLVVCGIGIALVIDADVGVAPWDVLHKGISEHTGVSVGTVIILVGVALLALFLPLRVRPGLGTALNAVLIGATVDVVGTQLPAPDNVAAQLGEMIGGVVAFGIGTALYISAGLGPGPRDGLMTGLASRGPSVRLARTGIEVAVLVIGIALGGPVGIGTAVFAFSIGPIVQFFLQRFSMRTALTP